MPEFDRRTFLKGVGLATIALLDASQAARASHTRGIENQKEIDMEAIERSSKNIFEDFDQPFFIMLRDRLKSGLRGNFFDIEIDPNKNSRSYFYFPEGKTVPRSLYRFLYYEQYGPSQGPDGNPYFVQYAETHLQVCSDGTLSAPINGVVQFQIEQVKELLANYFKTPKSVEGKDWDEKYGLGVSTVYKEYRGPLGLHGVGGTTTGLLVLKGGMASPIDDSSRHGTNLHIA